MRNAYGSPRGWSHVPTPASCSTTPPPRSLSRRPTLPRQVGCRTPGWVGRTSGGTRGSLNIAPPALLVSTLHPRVQLGAWLGQGDLEGAVDTQSGQGEGQAPPCPPPLPPPHIGLLTVPRTQGPACSWLRSWLEEEGPEGAHHPYGPVLGALTVIREPSGHSVISPHFAGEQRPQH